MSLTTARMAAALDSGLSACTHVAWSEDGSTESANVAKTAVTLGAATNANPSVKSNSASLESAGASSGCTITHFAFSDGTNNLTTWNQLDTAIPLVAGGKITVAAGALKENLHQTTSPPA